MRGYVKERVRLIDEIEFTCPFCKKDCSYGTDPTDNTDVVVHAWPMCGDYEKREASEYIAACAREVKKYAPN